MPQGAWTRWCWKKFTGRSWSAAQGKLCLAPGCGGPNRRPGYYRAATSIWHDYGPAWELVEYLVRDGEFDARTGEERDMDYKRTLSRKNTKAYLIVDRMIAEFLHGDEDCGELLKGLQSQLDTALGE